MDDYEMFNYLDRGKDLLQELIDDEDVSEPYVEAILQAVEQLSNEVYTIIAVSSGIVAEVETYMHIEDAQKRLEELKVQYNISEDEDLRVDDKNDVYIYARVIK